MTLCYLSLGSNLGDPQRQLRRAIKHIKQIEGTSLLKVSSLYFNKAWGRKQQPDFYNAVVAIKTRLPPLKLLSCCQAIERKHNRQRKVRWGARTLDIDIILYGDTSLNLHNLVIPHPRFLERDFVLIPLAEVTGNK